MSSVPGDHLTWRLLRSGLVHGYRQTARIMNTHLVTVIFFISSCRDYWILEDGGLVMDGRLVTCLECLAASP